MYRLLSIASSLLVLVATTSALTVVDTTKAATNSRVDIVSYGIVDQTASADNACCADYPFCGCPKLESPKAVVATQKKRLFVKLPPAKQPVTAKSDSPCCPDYPFCGCPKLETPNKKPRFKVINVGAAAKSRSKVSPLMVRRPPKAVVTASAKGTCSCCPDYPYCSCPKV